MRRMAITSLLCVVTAGCGPVETTSLVDAAPPMRYPTATYFVTYSEPVEISFTSSVTQCWSKAEGRPMTYRSTMMQSQKDGTPPSPGRVQWEFVGTVKEGDVYVVRIYPDMGGTNAVIKPVIYSGSPLEVVNNELLHIRIADKGE